MVVWIQVLAQQRTGYTALEPGACRGTSSGWHASRQLSLGFAEGYGARAVNSCLCHFHETAKQRRQDIMSPTLMSKLPQLRSQL